MNKPLPRIVGRCRRTMPARIFMGCPKCGSDNSKISGSMPWYLHQYEGRCRDWYCEDCNHVWRNIELNHASSLKFLAFLEDPDFNHLEPK